MAIVARRRGARVHQPVNRGVITTARAAEVTVTVAAADSLAKVVGPPA
jgi:hypothetical protein